MKRPGLQIPLVRIIQQNSAKLAVLRRTILILRRLYYGLTAYTITKLRDTASLHQSV
jgi:hypothetical protein